MSNALLSHFDFWSLVVIVLTLALFVIALFIKGFTHEERLEQLRDLLQRVEARTAHLG
jgi:hypothetical protein